MGLIDLLTLSYEALAEMAKKASSTEPEDNATVVVVPPSPTVADNATAPSNSNTGAMRTSKQGRIELANYEALANTKYVDSGGVHTIAIGATVSEIPDLVKWAWDRALTDKECCDLFVKSLAKYENAVNKVLKVKITQAQFDALVSITYNIGVGDTTTLEGGMAGSTFMRRLNAGNDPRLVVSAMQAWNKDNGKVVNGLKIRRAAEGQVFLSGKYLNNGTVARIKVDSKTHKPIYSGRVDISELV